MTEQKMADSTVTVKLVDIDRLPPHFPTDQHEGAFWESLGRAIATFGFLEKVYENALSTELITRGFQVESQKRLEVYYEDQLVGEYFADVVVEEKIILEQQFMVFL